MKSQKTDKILETDLYQPIHDYLVRQGYTVKSEVKHCDVTAVKGDELVVVELKTAMNIDLLAQAALRQRLTDSVYVAIPRPRDGMRASKWRRIHYLLRRLELGLITVSFGRNKGDVRVLFDPEPFDREKSKQVSRRKRGSLLKEFDRRTGDYNVGGSTRKKIMTAYKEDAFYIACCLERYGELTPKKLRELGAGKKTLSILDKNFYGWYERVRRGVYKLTQKGYAWLEEYGELAAHYRRKLDAAVGESPSVDLRVAESGPKYG